MALVELGFGAIPAKAGDNNDELICMTKASNCDSPPKPTAGTDDEAGLPNAENPVFDGVTVDDPEAADELAGVEDDSGIAAASEATALVGFGFGDEPKPKLNDGELN